MTPKDIVRARAMMINRKWANTVGQLYRSGVKRGRPTAKRLSGRLTEKRGRTPNQGEPDGPSAGLTGGPLESGDALRKAFSYKEDVCALVISRPSECANDPDRLGALAWEITSPLPSSRLKLPGAQGGVDEKGCVCTSGAEYPKALFDSKYRRASARLATTCWFRWTYQLPL